MRGGQQPVPPENTRRFFFFAMPLLFFCIGPRTADSWHLTSFISMAVIIATATTAAEASSFVVDAVAAVVD